MANEADINDEKRLELIQIAMAMIDGTLDLITGTRQICMLRHELGDLDNEAFITIRGFESETDDFPLGKEREGYADRYLKRLDDDATHYVAEAKDVVIDACREIIRTYSI